VPLVYVTGISGAGKSAVRQELRRRGYEALGVDEDGYGRWLDPHTGEERTYPTEKRSDSHEWYAAHDWVLDVSKIAELKKRVDRDASLVFLCGVAAGDGEAWEYFDVVCALVIDEATIKARIDLRNDNWFGKRPHELDQILAWNFGYAGRYQRFGAVIVDATKPLSDVVDAVIATVSS
jgi:broad-specificity NMP kinase